MKRANIFAYEFRKFVASKRMIALFLAILCLFGYNMMQANQQTKEYDRQLLWDLRPYRTSVSNLSDSAVMTIIEMERLFKEEGIDPLLWYQNEEYAKVKETYDKYNDAYFVLDEEFQMVFVPLMYNYEPARYSEKERWVETRLKTNALKQELFEEGSVGTLDRVQTELKAQGHFYQYLKDHQMTEYDSPNEINGANFLVNMFKGYSLFIIFCLFAFHMVYAYTIENDNETYKLLMGAPISRTRLAFSRFIFHTVCMIVMIVVCALIGFTVASIIGGLGNFGYPQIINRTEIIPTSTYLLYAIGTSVLAILSFNALVACITTLLSFFENAMIATGIVLVILVFMRLLNVTEPILYYIFPYLFVFGDIFIAQINQVSILLVVACACIHIAVFVFANIWMLKRKDFGNFQVFDKRGARV